MRGGESHSPRGENQINEIEERVSTPSSQPGKRSGQQRERKRARWLKRVGSEHSSAHGRRSTNSAKNMVYTSNAMSAKTILGELGTKIGWGAALNQGLYS